MGLAGALGTWASRKTHLGAGAQLRVLLLPAVSHFPSGGSAQGLCGGPGVCPLPYPRPRPGLGKGTSSVLRPYRPVKESPPARTPSGQLLSTEVCKKRRPLSSSGRGALGVERLPGAETTGPLSQGDVLRLVRPSCLPPPCDLWSDLRPYGPEECAQPLSGTGQAPRVGDAGLHPGATACFRTGVL